MFSDRETDRNRKTDRPDKPDRLDIPDRQAQTHTDRLQTRVENLLKGYDDCDPEA